MTDRNEFDCPADGFELLLTFMAEFTALLGLGERLRSHDPARKGVVHQLLMLIQHLSVDDGPLPGPRRPSTG